MTEKDAPLVLAGLEDAYDQVQLMAIGGMAEVYRSRQKSLDRAVAIKRIKPELRANKDIRERFRREAKSSANLLHQNLAHVYDYKTLNDESYIIMEYIDGFDLAEVIERTGPLPIDVSAMIALRILSGLSHVHSHGMVHRDLKPDNVRLSTRGEIKIMDFGIAYDPGDTSLTLPGTLIGSPHYLAPEQIIGHKLDARVDLFSFGVTFYEMLTGKKPFVETQNESIYTRIQKGEFISPVELRPEVPAFFLKIIESCLAVNPAKRPSSAESLAASLGQFLANNYAVSGTARVRQFLIQSKMLHGSASSIEIQERTFGGVTSGGFAQMLSRYKVQLVLAGLLVIATLALLFYSRRGTDVKSDNVYTVPLPRPTIPPGAPLQLPLTPLPPALPTQSPVTAPAHAPATHRPARRQHAQ